MPQAAKARRDWVLDRMDEDGNATEAEVAAAKSEPIALRHREEADTVTGAYFAEEVRRELVARFGEKHGLSRRSVGAHQLRRAAAGGGRQGAAGRADRL